MIKAPVPTEKQEQRWLFAWAEIASNQNPLLALLYSIPNAGGYTGGFRANMLRVIAMKKEGVKAGVPDVHLPVARAGYHSLYIEMKRQRGGKVSPEQIQWRRALEEEGHRVVVAKGFEEARAAIEDYLR